ncbi:MAG: class I SAM-dependent methyltransferase [Bacteroidia bacterium]|nr:class I SAM-dependent methyltransferase [Bacteroidia bacterium]
MKNRNPDSCCSLCQSRSIESVFHLAQVPTQDGVMYDSHSGAKSAPQGGIELILCEDCGYVENIGYEDKKVGFDEYDFSLSFSPLFSNFIDQLTEELIEKHELWGKPVLEIGCGDGYFLKKICRKAKAWGVGIDPGYVVEQDNIGNWDPIIIRDYYDDKHALIKPDIIFCRHVLNVNKDPLGFLKRLRKNLEDHKDCTIYFEVPNANYTFGEKVLWNVVFEHKSWFTEDSLSLLFELCGFEVSSTGLCWNDEYLMLEARPRDMDKAYKSSINKKRIQSFVDQVKEFNKYVGSIQTESIARLNEISTKETRTVMWGAGARGVSFLNMFKLNGLIECVVDINPMRQGKFMPISAHKVVAPDDLKEINPELIIINNPTYAEEIMHQSREIGLEPEFWVL